jgi:hypothetical protein
MSRTSSGVGGAEFGQADDKGAVDLGSYGLAIRATGGDAPTEDIKHHILASAVLLA